MGRPDVFEIVNGEPVLNGDVEDIETIDKLYAEDREEEALAIIDRMLGLGGETSEEIRNLETLMKGKSKLVMIPKMAGQSIEIYARPGGGLVHDMMGRRCKCFSALIDRAPHTHARALDNVELVQRLFPKEDDLMTMSAQIVFFVAHDEKRARKMIDEVLKRNPRAEAAKRTLDWFDRSKGSGARSQGGSDQGSSDPAARAEALCVEILQAIRRGQTQMDMAILDQIREYATEALSADNSRATPWACLAFTWSLVNDRNHTLDCLKKAQKCDPSDSLTQIVASSCRSRGWI